MDPSVSFEAFDSFYILPTLVNTFLDMYIETRNTRRRIRSVPMIMNSIPKYSNSLATGSST